MGLFGRRKKLRVRIPRADRTPEQQELAGRRMATFSGIGGRVSGIGGSVLGKAVKNILKRG